MLYEVTNVTEEDVTRAGRVFERRSTRVVELSGPRLAEVRAATALRVDVYVEEDENTEEQEVEAAQEEAGEPETAEEAEEEQELENMTRDELREVAQEREIPGYSMLNKDQLIEAIEEDMAGEEPE